MCHFVSLLLPDDERASERATRGYGFGKFGKSYPPIPQTHTSEHTGVRVSGNGFGVRALIEQKHSAAIRGATGGGPGRGRHGGHGDNHEVSGETERERETQRETRTASLAPFTFSSVLAKVVLIRLK